MNSHKKKQVYEKIKADLLEEAQAVGVFTRGAPPDPVLELLINGFSRELESIYQRVDRALEYNSRTLLRNYFQQPFLGRPAQTVVEVELNKPGRIGPDLEVAWRKAVDGVTPEYSLLGDLDMVPLELGAAYYWVGNHVYRLRWDDSMHMSSTRFQIEASTKFPVLLLALNTSADELDSGHLSLLVRPNETSLAGAFPGDDPQRRFVSYLDDAAWMIADGDGEFKPQNTLHSVMTESGFMGFDETSRFPTEASFFTRMESEHLFAPLVRRFASGITLPPAAVPAPLADAFLEHPELNEDSPITDASRWLQIRFPYVIDDDPRTLLSSIVPNARLAVGYRRLPEDTFNFQLDDYNVSTELFELGLGDRPGQFCKNFGQWVVSSFLDQSGHEYEYIGDAIAGGQDKWYTLDVGEDDVTLIVHLPRRKVPQRGHFKLYTGVILGETANTSQMDILMSRPRNALDYPEVEGLRLLMPVVGGGEGDKLASQASNSFEGGTAKILERQYRKAAVELRTQDRLVTLPDLKSFLQAMDSRIESVSAQRVAIANDGELVSGVRLLARFSKSAPLKSDEQQAVCRIATTQIQKRVPVGMWVEVKPDEGVPKP